MRYCAGDTGITYVSLGNDLEEDAHCLCGHVPVWTRARKLQPAKWIRGHHGTIM